MNSLLRLLTLVFWIAAPICAVALTVSTFAGRIGAWLLLNSVQAIPPEDSITSKSERPITHKNPLGDTERGEWTNKMLFYALVFTITFFVAFLYLPTLFFAR